MSFFDAPGKAAGQPGDDAAAYADRASDLSIWAQKHLVNRTDAWGGYNAVEDRDKIITRPDGSTFTLGATLTRPARRHRGTILLSPAVITRHFRACGPVDVIGLHTTSIENTSRWGTADIDHHGAESTSAAVNEAAAVAWYVELLRRGHRPLLWESNGAGGFHLDVILAAPVPTPNLYLFLRRLVADHADHGLPSPPETFPKQPLLVPRADGSGAYGNWLRVVGRHHTRPHWARVWDGTQWLAGAAAVNFILGLTGDDPALIPEAPPPPRTQSVFGGTATGSPGNLSACVARYLARLPNLAEGQGRDAVAYQFAAFLTRDLDLADDIALGWLLRWDAGNNPPKGEAALREITANARRYGRRAVGSGRCAPRRRRHTPPSTVRITLEIP